MYDYGPRCTSTFQTNSPTVPVDESLAINDASGWVPGELHMRDDIPRCRRAPSFGTPGIRIDWASRAGVLLRFRRGRLKERVLKDGDAPHDIDSAMARL